MRVLALVIRQFIELSMQGMFDTKAERKSNGNRGANTETQT